MRLIDTTIKTLAEFESSDAPPYAILSHTWTKEEITYQDLQIERKAGKEAGYAKLDNGCRLAASAGFNYIWLDTCCIDKTNHVELSEAINSMFHWYKQASICFAHLADVPPNLDPYDKESPFRRSKWFTRGWTLQELLAPSKITFLASDWTKFGTKDTLVSPIVDITGIPMEFLLGHDLEHASVAMRMSWASKRVTTKAEDIAYCLMGIFDIQMPLLYGEREAGAFRRLQQEIMKTSDDQSIFAWTSEDLHTPLHDSSVRQTYSLLAHSPASFRSSGHLVQTTAPVVPGYLEGIRTPTVFNNKGLHLSLPILRMNECVVLAILNCSGHGKDKQERTAIWLRDVSTNGGRYIRMGQETLEQIELNDILADAKYARISVIKGDDEGMEKCKHCFAARTQNTSMPSAKSNNPTPQPDVLTVGPTADYYGYSEGDMDNHTTNSILLPRGASAKVLSSNTTDFILAPQGPSEDVTNYNTTKFMRRGNEPSEDVLKYNTTDFIQAPGGPSEDVMTYNATDFMRGRQGPSEDVLEYNTSDLMRGRYGLPENVPHYDTPAYMRTGYRPSETVAYYHPTAYVRACHGPFDKDLWPSPNTTPAPRKPDSPLSLLKNRLWNRSAGQSVSGSIKGKGT
jgi:hypothetical protein